MSEEIQRLRKEMDEKSKEIYKQGETRLEGIRGNISTSVKEIISIYSNDVRNIGIVAGTVAPFSLSLLLVKELDLNVFSLLMGFSILLINILLTQFFLQIFSRTQDVRLRDAEKNYLFADISLREMTRTDDVQKSVEHMFEYDKRARSAEGSIGQRALDPHLLILRRRLRDFNFASFALLSTGVLLIIASVVLNPILSSLVNLRNFLTHLLFI